MDVMGSDALQSQEAMREMWGDSMKAVKSQHARITYEDFLLLMKGQSKDAPPEPQITSIPSKLNSSHLYVVPETEAASEDAASPVDSEDVNEKVIPVVPDLGEPKAIELSPSLRPLESNSGSQSAPGTPAGHKKDLVDVDPDESPLTLEGDGKVTLSDAAISHLTPPSSPVRGAKDFVTPISERRTPEELEKLAPDLSLPGLASSHSEQKNADLHVVADATRHMIVPEANHSLTSPIVQQNGNQSALAVNRQLYRAHRQMRLAVLEASKRFEEQQTRHARDVILAEREAEGKTDGNMGGMIQAGLVMRHGLLKQVSSESIRRLLLKNQEEQQALVEKANRRGGRGRRSRKKTISDMSGMLSSMGQDEMTQIAKEASDAEQKAIPEDRAIESPTIPEAAELVGNETAIRGATVPGNFRKTSDPFGSSGRYGGTISKSSG